MQEVASQPNSSTDALASGVLAMPARAGHTTRASLATNPRRPADPRGRLYSSAVTHVMQANHWRVLHTVHKAVETSKSVVPAPAPHELRRERLLEVLHHHRARPLILLVAPAGFGKSTL